MNCNIASKETLNKLEVCDRLVEWFKRNIVEISIDQLYNVKVDYRDT